MDRIEAAILRTVLYADVFHFPMNAAEIHHFLIHDSAISLTDIEVYLSKSARLRHHLHSADGYYALSDRAEIIMLRQRRVEAATWLWPQATRYGRWLACLPFVEMVAVTGALAMHNAEADDDLDYMIVTQPGRVWLARLFAIMLVRIVKIRGPVICPNYVVDSNTLIQERRDLFIAHEVTQMIPVYGHALYWRIRQLNAWTDTELPNARGPFHATDDVRPGALWLLLKRTVERILRGHPGDWLEAWERKRKVRRFTDAMQTPHSAAQIDESQVKGHFNDYGHGVLRAYEARLREHDLIEWAATGD